MSVEVAPLPKVAAVTGISSVLASYWTTEALFVVVLPIVATWFGMVGLGVIDEKPFRHILRNLVGSVLLGGVVGISAITCIAMLDASGEFAAFITLSIAMVPVAISKAVGRVGPRIIDAALKTAGLERIKDSDVEPGDG